MTRRKARRERQRISRITRKLSRAKLWNARVPIPDWLFEVYFGSGSIFGVDHPSSQLWSSRATCAPITRESMLRGFERAQQAEERYRREGPGPEFVHPRRFREMVDAGEIDEQGRRL